jgi:hypothetical protein
MLVSVFNIQVWELITGTMNDILQLNVILSVYLVHAASTGRIVAIPNLGTP